MAASASTIQRTLALRFGKLAIFIDVNASCVASILHMDERTVAVVAGFIPKAERITTVLGQFSQQRTADRGGYLILNATMLIRILPAQPQHRSAAPVERLAGRSLSLSFRRQSHVNRLTPLADRSEQPKPAE